MTPEHTDITGAARLREALERAREDIVEVNGRALDSQRYEACRAAIKRIDEALAAVPETREGECLHWHVERSGTAHEPAPVAVCVECGVRFAREAAVPETPEPVWEWRVVRYCTFDSGVLPTRAIAESWRLGEGHIERRIAPGPWERVEEGTER